MPTGSAQHSTEIQEVPKSSIPSELLLVPRDFESRSIRSAGDWYFPFEPARWLRSGHAQTLAGNYWRRLGRPLVAEAVSVEVDATDGSRVLCYCHWQPQPVRASRLTILLVHGLEGSSDSRYMLGISSLAWDAGCNVVRMNMRNCGGTEQWTPTLYHSGMSSDVKAVLEHLVTSQGLARVAMVGYSMGGNLVLKLAGELGKAAPDWLTAAVGVSPATDLAPSADALHEPANRFYEWHFLRNLMRRFRRKIELYPDIYSANGVGPVRTIREFDEQITARYSGFSGADDYYFRASSARVLARIGIPTLVLHSTDDPFIRMTPVSRRALSDNPNVRLIETHHGGHCAFLSKKSVAPASKSGSFSDTGRGNRHWAEATLVRFLMANIGHADGS